MDANFLSFEQRLYQCINDLKFLQISYNILPVYLQISAIGNFYKNKSFFVTQIWSEAEVIVLHV